MSQSANFACTSVVRLLAKANISKITWQESKSGKKIYNEYLNNMGVDLRKTDYKVKRIIPITTTHKCLSILVVTSTLSAPLSPRR